MRVKMKSVKQLEREIEKELKKVRLEEVKEMKGTREVHRLPKKDGWILFHR